MIRKQSKPQKAILPSQKTEAPAKLRRVQSKGVAHPFCGKSSGYTLVELMVTVSLIAMFALAASSAFDTRAWLAQFRLKDSARQLAQNMQRARINAVKDNTDWAIVFVPGPPDQYFLCSNPGPDMTWSTVADNTVVETVTLPSQHGIRFGGGSATQDVDGTPLPADSISFPANVARFTPNGLASASGYCYLTNNTNDSCAVGSLTSGAVRTRKWQSNAWK